MSQRTTHAQLGGIIAAWVALLAVGSPLVPYDLPMRLTVTIGFGLAAVTIIWAVRGQVMLAAMRLGRQVEREAAALPRGPRRVA